MLLVRVVVPNRPGSLGAVATAMGSVGADILAVEIVERDEETALDDFMVSLPTQVLPDALVSACNALPDVEVLWLSRYPTTAGLLSDLSLLEQMASDPERAPWLLTEHAPAVFHCHWALLADVDSREVLHASPMAPDLAGDAWDRLGPWPATDGSARGTADALVLPEGWLPDWGETLVARAPVNVPDRNLSIVVGRQGGPPFVDSELVRLRYLARLA
ncbi:ACT domain-containing protein [Parenemella sanctibonifatiensis]|uniref:Amino acid-binding protein n=1 Tax=Parenemella sanctibonifatiensis TaxID=2016505 RepID=A0A255EAY9_9ACTN|nr:hypothetical protein [Parenemella sanctibonifatiensis]OYN86572.1 amino acid-binding protein [Parenemella sanctibonifatiensis]OYN90992.1 amino acid-binding protein [Parenemella sanctibonifatiensis]